MPLGSCESSVERCIVGPLALTCRSGGAHETITLCKSPPQGLSESMRTQVHQRRELGSCQARALTCPWGSSVCSTWEISHLGNQYFLSLSHALSSQVVLGKQGASGVSGPDREKLLVAHPRGNAPCTRPARRALPLSAFLSQAPPTPNSVAECGETATRLSIPAFTLGTSVFSSGNQDTEFTFTSHLNLHHRIVKIKSGHGSRRPPQSTVTQKQLTQGCPDP